MNKFFKVYLAGFISEKNMEECLGWRKKIREYYTSKDYPIIWLDPLNTDNLETISENGLKSSYSANTIIHKDYMSIMNSDLIVVNLDTFGNDRPLIGTIAELAWAWEHHKPILSITTDATYKEHPFIKYFTSEFVSSLDELIERKLIPYFYKGLVTARY